MKTTLIENAHLFFSDSELFQALIDSSNTAMNGEKIVDIRAALIDKLNTKLDLVSEEQQNNLEAVREYFEAQNATNRVILDLLKVQSFKAFLSETRRSMQDNFNVEIAGIIVGKSDFTGHDTPHPALHVVSQEMAERYFEKPLSPHRPMVNMRTLDKGVVADDLSFVLFKKGSEAILKLDVGKSNVTALLVLVSRDVGLYSPDRATDILEYFREVYEQLLAKWLNQ